ncbi:MAG: hypothetical protein QG656_373 [Candidatus Hydrogenedentes bacterium]|nr:hypothetical protein [Candidatus Hydrogenedentota bacterium]
MTGRVFVHQTIALDSRGEASWTCGTYTGHAEYRDGEWRITKAESAGRPIELDGTERDAILTALEANRPLFAAQCVGWAESYRLKEQAWR